MNTYIKYEFTFHKYLLQSIYTFKHLARVVEHTDCISAEFLGYEIKQSNNEVPVLLELWILCLMAY